MMYKMMSTKGWFMHCISDQGTRVGFYKQNNNWGQTYGTIFMLVHVTTCLLEEKIKHHP